ncbi:MAG: hypothetical protein IKL65_05790 [Bacilli bacterium]|nr:hypothetical protein [Bacilli bacterium]
MKTIKKGIIYIVLVLFLCLSFSNVKASNTMKYINAKLGSDFYIVVDKDNYTMFGTNTKTYRSYIIKDYSIPDIWDKWYETTLYYSDSGDYLLGDKWVSTLYVCSYLHFDFTHAFSTGMFMIYDNYSQLPEENKFYIWEYVFGGDSIHCYPYVPEQKLTPEQLIYQCESYDNIIYDISEIFTDYANSTPEEKAIKLNQYNTSLNQLKTLCGDVLERTYYGDPCLKRCLYDMENDIKAIDESLEIIQGYGPCGFSQKLIHFIANIIKWAKYLIPVIVIIFGILDFIKALSSNKDDAMKKAQGHFIKRLIICALIFIIPFIIEFVLDKMGFAANGCGIIDL